MHGATATTAGRGRIETLDGLRAISIALVLLAHVSRTRGFPLLPGWTAPVAHNGALGVAVFFVISGLLITTLLVREQHGSGTIDLKQFYLRRSLRIFPAYYALLLTIALLRALGAVSVAGGEMWSALTYTRNFYPHGSWLTGHAWSLAIEEQFYLIWPLVLLRAGPRRAAWFALAVVCAAPVVRLATWFALPGQRAMIDWYTFTRLDSLMFGCLLALVREHPRFRAAAQRFYAAGGALACLAVVVASAPLRAFTPYDVVASYSVEGAAIALLLDWCVTHPSGRVGRALEQPLARRVGDLSYSLYLWQQPFLNHTSDFVLCRFPWNLGCAIGAALLSRAVIEKPFLRLKDRWQPAPRAAAQPAPVAARASVV